MKISHIKISNILGIDTLEFSPAGFTKITGPNGAGKSSILAAIKSATGQGHDATLLRKGQEKGEIVLILDDGTEIRERVTAKGTTRDVTHEGKKVLKPGEAIKQMTDALSVNPVEFLTARRQDRVKVLLESMPIKVDMARISKITGLPTNDKAAQDMHGLLVIDHYRKQVYELRTGTKRAVSEKDTTINQLQAAMPEAPGGIDGSEDELREKLEKIKADQAAEETRITNKLAGLRETRDSDVAAIEAQITELRLKIEATKSTFSTIEGKADVQRGINREKQTAASAPIDRALEAFKSNRDANAKRAATQDTIKTMAEGLAELESDVLKQTKALEAIDKYKEELLAELPIPGLEVKDGEITRDGIEFDRLNTAQQVGIAFEIAKLRAGPLPIVCLDGMELLDNEHLEELRTQAEAGGFQVFVTRVTPEGGEFSVESE